MLQYRWCLLLLQYRLGLHPLPPVPLPLQLTQRCLLLALFFELLLAHTLLPLRPQFQPKERRVASFYIESLGEHAAANGGLPPHPLLL